LIGVRSGAEEQIVQTLESAPEALIDAAAASRASEGPAGAGRGAVARVSLPDGSGAVLRKYRRGGLAGRLLPDRFPGYGRPIEELLVTERARKAGLPVPEPLAIIYKSAWFLRSCYLLSREVEGARTLAGSLAAAPEEGAGHLLFATARLVRSCHDAGLVHGDLNLGNILVVHGDPAQAGRADRSPAPGLVVLDLDRARFDPAGASDRDRFDNLSRLARSHEKTFGRPGPWGGCAGGIEAALVSAYAGSDEKLHARLLALLPRHRRGMRLHRAGWKLSSLLR
jgi:hypothetical protein